MEREKILIVDGDEYVRKTLYIRRLNTLPFGSTALIIPRTILKRRRETGKDEWRLEYQPQANLGLSARGKSKD